MIQWTYRLSMSSQAQDRIASALERIADALEAQAYGQEPDEAEPVGNDGLG